MVDFVPPYSSNIRAVSYDPDTLEMQVTFDNGTYSYAGVPEQLFNQFMQTPSAGGHFLANIRGKFPHRKIA